MECMRTCQVCRKKAAKERLCRFVRADDGELCFDERAILPHRGAWVCANKYCLGKGLRKRLLFRKEKLLPLNPEAMLAHVKMRVKKGVLNRLGLLCRQGQIEFGADAVKRASKNNAIGAIVFAEDFSSGSRRKIEGDLGDGSEVALVDSVLTMDEIGTTLGRKKTGVVALFQSRITKEILLQLDRLSEL